MMSKNLFILISCYAISWCIMALAFSATAAVGYELTHDKSLAFYPLIMQVFGACIIAIPGAKIMAMYGRRTGFMLGSAIGIIGGLMCAYSIYQQNFWLLVLSTPFLGMFTSFGEFARYAAADCCVGKQQKSRAISIVISGGVIAAFIGPSIANHSNQYFASTAAYLGPYLAAIVLCVLALILYSQLNIENKFKAEVKSIPSLDIIKNPVFLVATSAAAIGYLVMVAMMNAFPITMLEHGMHFADTTMVLQWHMLAMFAPSYLTARYINKFGVPITVFTGILFNVVGLVSALQGVMFFNFWVCLFMIGLGWNFMYLAGTDLITNIIEEQRPKAEGLSSLILMTSYALSAPIAAVILVNFGWVMVSAFSFFLLFIAGAMMLVNKQVVLQAYLPAAPTAD